MQVRNLFAVAHNITSRAPLIYGGDLLAAVNAMKPLMDAHFADEMHAYGRMPHAATCPHGAQSVHACTFCNPPIPQGD